MCTDLFSDIGEEFEIPHDQQHVINEVMRVYGECDGITLSTITHQKGTPWDNTPQGRIIPNELIKSHFKELMTQNEQH